MLKNNSILTHIRSFSIEALKFKSVLLSSIKSVSTTLSDFDIFKHFCQRRTFLLYKFLNESIYNQLNFIY